MILKNKYKEQMDKISVDDDMKKRVMNRIRESQYLKTKGNKSASRGQAFYKYSGVTAACCALAVTYAITVNYPELINNKNVPLNESEYKSNNDVNQNNIYEHNNEVTEENREVTRSSDDNRNSNENIDINGENVLIENDELELLYSAEDDVTKNNSNSYDRNNSASEIYETTEYDEKEHTNNEDKNNHVPMNHGTEYTLEADETLDDEKAEDSNIGNENLRVSFYGQDSVQREYLNSKGIPDLSATGFYIDYINQVSKDEVEIMYSNVNGEKIWIRICDNESDNKDDSIKDSQYDDKGSEINSDKENNNCIVYKKDNKDYCIWSDTRVNDDLINNIINCI